ALVLAAAGAPAVEGQPAADPSAGAIQPVPPTAVRLGDTFWAPRIETNHAVTVWYCFTKCIETGRIANINRAAGLEPGAFEGIPFNDSDVYKIIEGAAYVLARGPDARLDAYLDDLIARIAAAQEPDGYLYTARRLLAPDRMPPMAGRERWSNLRASHELYNVGHLYEAAAAHFQATGKRSLLDVALRNADLVCRTFGPAPDQRKDPPGHEEIELGLIKLFRVTGERRFLDQALFFIDQRGRPEGHSLYGENAQDHLPVVAQNEAVGHAV
ncbi:MAG: glycoside hydrolase family 127 protein, partial [bacterium]|nr:glycoside hydrolase family 127 protein [bacterium]